MKRALVAMVLLCLLFSKTCLADNNLTQISRYITVANKPKLSQVDLLSQIIQVRFPQNVQTIGGAINYLLRFSGYGLIARNQMSSALQTMLSKSLPLIDREFGPMSLREGLTTLSGSAFNLSQDPLNREINFLLKPEYQKFLKNRTIQRS